MCIDSMLFVLCNGCKADGPVAGTVDEAEAAWNNREGAAMDLAVHAHGKGQEDGQQDERAAVVRWLRENAAADADPGYWPGPVAVADAIEAGKHWEK